MRKRADARSSLDQRGDADEQLAQTQRKHHSDDHADELEE